MAGNGMPEDPATSLRQETGRTGTTGAPQDIDEILSSYDYGLGPRRHGLRATLDGALDGLRRHWLAVVNTALGLFIGTALLAPVGYALGIGGASSVFHAYHLFCAQTPSHSFFIAGYQVCLCARCLAIYSSVLLGGLLLALLRGRRDIGALGWRFWLLAMVPMALDGGTQLFGLRESNVALRLLTGGLFGLATAWFMLPQIEASSRPAFRLAPAAAPGIEGIARE